MPHSGVGQEVAKAVEVGQISVLSKLTGTLH